jgi:putative ABC transport system permease protein
MSLPSRLSSLLRNIFRKPRVDRELDAELRAYLDMAADELRSAGMTDAEARRAALVELQGLEQVKEQVRDARHGAVLEQLRQDVSYAGRMFVKHRGFTTAAVLTLALGIGAATAVFSIVDTVIYRPLPYKEPGRLVKITGNSAGLLTDDVSFADFADLRDRNQVFEQMAADDGTDYTVTINGKATSVLGGMVTTSWLPTLGVQPIVGRSFLPEEDQPGRNHVVILTAQYWRRAFGADPLVAGRTVTVNGAVHTIVGVLPPNVLRYEADILVPLVPAEYPVERSHSDLDAFARLRPGVTLAQARANVDAISRALALEHPATNSKRGMGVVPLEKYYLSIGSKSRQGLLLMLGAVGLVLLIACVNVASLMLARAQSRGRECLIRAALGASRGRLVRQLLVENLLLFLAGGALGLLTARWSIDSLHGLAVANGYVPARLAVAVDGRVFAFSIGLSLVTGILFGLAPALRASRVDLNQGLRDGGFGGPGGPRHNRGRKALIVAELTLSLVLLTSFGLLARSFARVHAAAAGMALDLVIETGSDGGRQFAPAVGFWREAIAQAQAIPGIEIAAVSSRPPVHDARDRPFRVEGMTDAPPGRGWVAGDILVSAGYFQTLGIPLVQGRSFTEADHASSVPVAIVSHSLASRFFKGTSALGQRIEVIQEEDPISGDVGMRCCSAARPQRGLQWLIVGVAGDVRQANLDAAPAMTIYRPSTQIVEHDMFLLLRARTAADAARIAPDLRERLRAGIGKDWWDARLLRQVVTESESVRLRRFVLILLGSFAALALVLSAVGLYGVTAYMVEQQRREIGIRVALGATSHRVLRQVVGDALRLAAVALVIGALATQAVNRLIATMLFGVSRTDALTYGMVWLLLAAVAVIASYIPARRAARIDPIAALKEP